MVVLKQKACIEAKLYHRNHCRCSDDWRAPLWQWVVAHYAKRTEGKGTLKGRNNGCYTYVSSPPKSPGKWLKSCLTSATLFGVRLCGSPRPSTMMITCIMSGAPSSDSSHPKQPGAVTFLSYELICLTFHQEAVKMSSKYNIKQHFPEYWHRWEFDTVDWRMISFFLFTNHLKRLKLWTDPTNKYCAKSDLSHSCVMLCLFFKKDLLTMKRSWPYPSSKGTEYLSHRCQPAWCPQYLCIADASTVFHKGKRRCSSV